MEEDFRFASHFNEKWSILTRQMLRLLSEDSRISISAMAKKLNVSRKTIRNKLRDIENEFGIAYTLELDEKLLGLTNPHLILLEFVRKPDYNEIKETLESSHIPQLAIKMRGEFDMLIYANCGDTSEYVYWDKTMQVQFSKYGVLWQPSDFAFTHIGFFPLRNTLIQRSDMSQDYKNILLLLNENSRMSFREISKKLGMHFNTVAYNFNKLLKLGYIKRFTIVMKRPPKVSMTVLLTKYTMMENFENEAMRARKEVTLIDDKVPLISRCLLSAQLVGSYDFVFAGVYDNDKIGRHPVNYFKMRFKRHHVRVIAGVIDGIALGHFPTRNLDVRKEFNMIRWIPGGTFEITKPIVEQAD